MPSLAGGERGHSIICLTLKNNLVLILVQTKLYLGQTYIKTK